MSEQFHEGCGIFVMDFLSRLRPVCPLRAVQDIHANWLTRAPNNSCSLELGEAAIERAHAPSATWCGTGKIELCGGIAEWFLKSRFGTITLTQRMHAQWKTSWTLKLSRSREQGWLMVTLTRTDNPRSCQFFGSFVNNEVSFHEILTLLENFTMTFARIKIRQNRVLNVHVCPSSQLWMVDTILMLWWVVYVTIESKKEIEKEEGNRKWKNK